MTWICETCGREFRNTNQWHSCEQSTVDQHLENKPEFIKTIFHRFLDIILEIGKFELLPLKTVIQLQKSSTFLSIYLKKNKVSIEFQSSGKMNLSCITKSVKISKNRFFHHAEIKNVNEISDELITAIKEAYHLSEPIM